ncbi:flagellar hook-basal body complex protein FliE [Rubinisphaera sp.]|uniref:flagellar hook-basal body complex protein FliE n=1 Tax=Rubinisphaera sp. TaxID=2024857 RepID=UPI000C0EF463|nr:flagellar hook-basal body complex protein FliE [Rubinisphaera sp.]MBV09709.1 flagellar hook-basal body complex protein FliE [Rubinisphaera sp.]HCS54116.1 flagellar hook-basal body complex protein FliE [Planctomycetaceae bacterium]|tara:strand:- start:9253 stop:9561 length:309 start_codon:yes stop_codon:yes gene_type:complete
MNPSIQPTSITPGNLPTWNPPVKSTEGSQPVDFQKMLFDSIQETSNLGHTAEQNIETRLMGGNITSAEVFTSMKKADMALKMMMQVRNKLVSAYQEVQQMRM